MLSEYKKRINLGVGIGFILHTAGKIMFSGYAGHGHSVILAGYIIFALAIPIFIYGLSMYAKAKGRHWAWGFLGFLSLFGLIILYFLKDNNRKL